MKRFHVPVHVRDLSQSISFYTQFFSTPPARTESDYAKWMLEDAPVNFAISTRGEAAGIDHLGIQTDNEHARLELKQRAQAADMALLDVAATTCCCASSEKHWVTDPQGIAWEHFHTLNDIPVFRERQDDPAAGTCCAPIASATNEETSCCAPAKSVGAACFDAPSTAISAFCSAPTFGDVALTNRHC